MRNKSLAVGSGKGGVGKTTTAVNLAIYYARLGYTTALVDVDPLSNAASLLDIEREYDTGRLRADDSLDSYILPVFRNLDILFPGTKTGADDSRLLRTLIFETFAAALEATYDLLIFDLPAGMDAEENLAFLPFIENLIIVTNPEPTAHVAAGAYLKAVLKVAPDIRLHLWHNRYNGSLEGGSDYRDVVDTYNRNMPEEEHLPLELKQRVRSVAFVPQDPALDLLQGTPSSIMNVHRSLLSVVDQLIETRVGMIVEEAPFHSGIRRLLTCHLANRVEESESSFLQGFGEYVSGLLLSAFNISAEGTSPFTEAEEQQLKIIYRRVREDRRYSHMRRIQLLLNRKIDQLEDETRLFSKGVHIEQDRNIDREIGLLLRSIQRSSGIEALRPNASILLFYFALYKLLQSPTVVSMLNDLIPFREGDRGEPIRDRRSQITQLVHSGEEYRKRYFYLIKTIFPVVGRQIEAISKAFELHSLLLRDPGSRKIRSDSYAKLLSNFVHDTLYSGLSVIIGFEYRSAAIAFQKGADILSQGLLNGRRKSA